MQNMLIALLLAWGGGDSQLKITPDNGFPNLYLYEVNLCI